MPPEYLLWVSIISSLILFVLVLVVQPQLQPPLCSFTTEKKKTSILFYHIFLIHDGPLSLPHPQDSLQQKEISPQNPGLRSIWQATLFFREQNVRPIHSGVWSQYFPGCWAKIWPTIVRECRVGASWGRLGCLAQEQRRLGNSSENLPSAKLGQVRIPTRILDLAKEILTDPK